MDSRHDAFPFVSPLPDTRIDAGQALHLPVAAGTVLVACAGRLHVEGPPRWLGEQMVVTGHDLAEGQVHVVGDAGWVRVGALDLAGGRLRRIDPQWTPGGLLAWPGRLVRGWRGVASPGMRP